MKGILLALLCVVFVVGVGLFVFGPKNDYTYGIAGNGLASLSEALAPSLQLLAEKHPDARAKLKKLVAKSKGDEQVCIAMGPFASGATAQNIISRLTAVDIESTISSVDIDGVPDFWVFMPPLSDRRAALSKIKELQSQKIDSFIITQGELENGISLGLFSEEYRAVKVQKDIVAKGYAVDVREVPRPHREYWVVVNAESKPLFSDAIWTEIQRENDQVKRRLNRC